MYQKRPERPDGSAACAHVEHYGHYGEDGVGNPHGHQRRRQPRQGEGLRYGHEQDVAEAEHQSYADVHAHTAFHLAARQGHAYDGEDESRRRHGEAAVVFHLEARDVAHAAPALSVDIGREVGRGHLLVVVLGDEEVARLEGDDGVEARAAGDDFAVVAEVAYHIVVDAPVVERVPHDALRREARAQTFLLVEALEREAGAGLGDVVVAAHVGDLPRLHHQHDVGAVVHAFVLDVGVGVVDALDVGRRDDVGVEHEGGGGYDGCCHKIGPQQAPEAHARGEHGYDLAVAGQLGCEEDDGNEGEQRRELVGEIRQEVDVVFQYGGTERCLEEGVELLVDVEHHHDGQQQYDGKNVGAEEFPYYVAVENLEHGGGCYRRRFTRSSMSRFHAGKSPAWMCLRASPASHR